MKLIRESDDFDWVRDVEPSLVDFFVKGEEYYMGLIDGSGRIKNFKYWDPNYIVSTYEDGRGAFKFGSDIYSPLYIETMLKYNKLTLEDLIVNKLNESDDFDWARDVEPNPFHNYDGVVFREGTTKSDVEKFIKMALDSGRHIRNRGIWTDDYIEEDVDQLMRYIDYHGQSYLQIEKSGDLTFGHHNKYSDLIGLTWYETNTNLNESDDFEWIRNTNTLTFPILRRDLPNLVGHQFVFYRDNDLYRNSIKGYINVWTIISADTDGVEYKDLTTEYTTSLPSYYFLEKINKHPDKSDISWPLLNPNTNDIYNYYGISLKDFE